MDIRITAVSYDGIKKIAAKRKVGYLEEEHRKEEERVRRYCDSSFKPTIYLKTGYIKDTVTISQEYREYIEKHR